MLHLVPRNILVTVGHECSPRRLRPVVVAERIWIE